MPWKRTVLVVLGAIATVAVPARQASAAEPALSGPSAEPPAKKVLFVHGGWEGHEPEECRDLFVPWMRSLGWDVSVSDSLDAYGDVISVLRR